MGNEAATFSVDRPSVLRAGPSIGAPDLRERQKSFDAVLGRASTGLKGEPEPPEQMAREAAEQLVTQCLILPMLKQLRSSNQAAPPFAPSQAEKQFGALGDAQLAQRITQASHFPLVDRLARDLLKRAGLDVDGRSAADELRAASVHPPTRAAPIMSPDRSPRTWQD